MLKQLVSDTIDRSVILSSMNYGKGQLLHRLGLRAHRSGSTHRQLKIDESVQYIRTVVNDYLHYSGAGDSGIAGKNILEIGPGDTLGVALVLYSLGARSVTSLDGFQPAAGADTAAIYRALIDTMDVPARERAGQAVRFDGSRVEFNPEAIRSRYNSPVEDAERYFPGEKFDIVLSRAVLEHIQSPAAAWKSMVALLAPRGEMWHKIDLRNHNFFRSFHPLHFLTIPQTWWDAISSPDPTLNRARRREWVALSEATFEYTQAWVDSLLNKLFDPHLKQLDPSHMSQEVRSAIQAIRGRLVLPYRDYSDEDLAVTGIFLISRVPKVA